MRSRLFLSIIVAVMIVGLTAQPGRAQDNGDKFLQDAKAAVKAATTRVTQWDGPTTGPKAQPNKLIVYIASDMLNSGPLGVSRGVREATAAIGWTVFVIDGLGTVEGRTQALQQATALKPDGIVLSGWDPKEQDKLIQSAAQGIKFVGWHAAYLPGPMEGSPVITNVSTDTREVSRISALYAVAASEGTANVVIFTDSQFTIATNKANAMADVIKQCIKCTVLAVKDVHLNEVPQVMSSVNKELLGQFGDKWTYSLGINDLYFDFGNDVFTKTDKKPTDPPFSLSGGDGSESAYKRIRDGNRQLGTVPEPLNLQGWQIVDELNRAFAGEPPSSYVAPVHLVVSDNIGFDGGPNNVFDPENGYRDAYRHIWIK